MESITNVTAKLINSIDRFTEMISHLLYLLRLGFLGRHDELLLHLESSEGLLQLLLHLNKDLN